MTLINEVVSAHMKALNVPYISTVALTSNADGDYDAYLTAHDSGRRQLMRANDGIHMSMAGYLRISEPVVERLKADAGSGLAPGPGTGSCSSERGRRRGVIRGLVLASVLAAAAFVAGPGFAVAQERPWTPLPSPQSRSCPDGLCQARALAPLFRALDGRWGGVVRIVQFGDSHTAGRLIPGSLETRLRARFPARDIRIEPIGVVGVTLTDLKNHPLPVLDAPVDLIVLAFGTNEGFDDGLEPPPMRPCCAGRSRGCGGWRRRRP
jgi:hypothetical protein